MKIFPIKYSSFQVDKISGGKIVNKITHNNYFQKKDIKKNFVLIKVSYTNINYKDVLISKNKFNLIKQFPHTPGIDASGIIYYSNSKKFKKNDKVMIIARPLGIEQNGSFSEYISVPDNWVDKLPNRLSLKESMMIGTSGFTAIKAVDEALKTILKNKKDPVLITGATGNVGTYIIFLLTSYGINFEVTSSKKKDCKILSIAGVKKIHPADKFLNTKNFSLLNEKYSVIFDNLGGDMISGCIKFLIKDGIFISIGNILSNVSNLNILPLILRGVNIKGINAEQTSSSERKSIFKKFNSRKINNKLKKVTKMVDLKDVPKIINSKNYQDKSKRFIVKI